MTISGPDDCKYESRQRICSFFSAVECWQCILVTSSIPSLHVCFLGGSSFEYSVVSSGVFHGGGVCFNGRVNIYVPRSAFMRIGDHVIYMKTLESISTSCALDFVDSRGCDCDSIRLDTTGIPWRESLC